MELKVTRFSLTRALKSFSSDAQNKVLQLIFPSNVVALDMFLAARLKGTTGQNVSYGVVLQVTA